MDFSEFKKRLGAEPRAQDAQMQAARRSGPEFEHAAADAERLEQRIESVLRFRVNEDALLREVLSLPGQPVRATPRRWLAIAASIALVAVATSLVAYRAMQPRTPEDYVVSHYRHDGNRLLSRASQAFDRSEVPRVMARFDARVSHELAEKIAYIKICPTLHGKGAHMVLATDQGPVSVIFMPETILEHAIVLSFDTVQARSLSLNAGSAFIISPEGTDVSAVDSLLRRAIRPVSADV